MNWMKFLVPLGGVVVVAGAWNAAGWPGVALAVGGLVMWGLLHVMRMMTVVKRASGRPIGFVDSAVMLNAKLRPGVRLLHVLAMTRALGALQSPKDTQPEIYRWTDAGDSSVTCEFLHGRLVQWRLQRPAEPDAEPNASSASPG